MKTYKRRYEIAEEVLRRNGSDEEIQRRIMQAFPNSKENKSRATWYRRSFRNYGHCRGLKAKKNPKRVVRVHKIDSVLDRLEAQLANRSDIYVRKVVERLIRKDHSIVEALKERYCYRCQFPGCRVEIQMADGGFYCEVAHLLPAASGGRPTRVNLVVLCPNHHKMIDYGRLEVTGATRSEIVGTLNGKKFRIER